MKYALPFLFWGFASCSAPRPYVHMVTYTTQAYKDHFEASLGAKEAYARHWGFSWEVFNESTLDCSDFRKVRWRGDQRYCKLAALTKLWKRIQAEPEREKGRQDYIFWHDVDTNIMQPEKSLHAFLEAAGNAPIVFTDNALSLNNGAFFLEVSRAGRDFFNAWRKECRKGDWPWADNGCMYEVMLQLYGGDAYSGRCRRFRVAEFDAQRPEPPTGTQLMRCFNEEMDRLGKGCCGSARGIEGVGFLTGQDNSFNDHPCHELQKNKDLTSIERSKIAEHCFVDGMFMVHTKEKSYGTTSALRVKALTTAKPEL